MHFPAKVLFVTFDDTFKQAFVAFMIWLTMTNYDAQRFQTHSTEPMFKRAHFSFSFDREGSFVVIIFLFSMLQFALLRLVLNFKMTLASFKPGLSTKGNDL